jgi:Zn-dependent protease
MQITPDRLQMVLVGFLPFLFALSFHEFAHGWVAKLKGDRTAEIMGRLTLNPMAHADILGTIILPIMAMLTPGLMMFGWAKPVPVNERNLKNPRKDMFWVAAAGPLSNLLLALVATGVMYLFRVLIIANAPSQTDRTIWLMLSIFVQINLVLAVFNLIPLHPLDGGKVLARFLPEQINQKLENAQAISGIILFALVFSGVFSIILRPAVFLADYLIFYAGGGFG